MPGRRMLREMMSVNDIYSFADPIMEMLREEYGSYDADTLDEVQVDERFVQRLQARGYEVRTGNEQPAPPPTPAPIPPSIAAETPVVPVTVVRARRPAAGTTGGPATGPTRTRRTTTPVDGTRPATRLEASRAGSDSARPAAGSARPAADSGGDPAPSADASSGEAERPTRARRATRPRSTDSSNGDTTS